MIEIRWHGRGGQGAFTAARILGLSAALYADKYAMAFPSFGPERRGAPVLAFTKISDTKIHDRSEITSCDYIVVLDQTLFSLSMLNDLKDSGKIFINSEKNAEAFVARSVEGSRSVVTFDATAAALAVLGRPITNTAMLGALIGHVDIMPLDAVVKGIKHEMKPALVEKNIELVKRSYRDMRGEADEASRS